MKHFLQEKEEKCSNDTNPAKLTQKITKKKKTAQAKRRSIPTKATEEKTNTTNIKMMPYKQREQPKQMPVDGHKQNKKSAPITKTFTKITPDRRHTKSAPTNTTFRHSAR